MTAAGCASSQQDDATLNDNIWNETELIQTYLAPLAAGAAGAFGLADDAALIETEDGVDLVVSTDPVIAGVHFFADDAPQDIAWKALAVNISDLAAKGADPLCYTMALAFPDAPRGEWMTGFATGLLEAQTAFGCRLMGGDTDQTPGPLSISITAFGKVARGGFLRRAGAGIGDHVFVSGTIGDAALGLLLRTSEGALGNLEPLDREFLLRRYLRPQPRVELIPLLKRYASAALDVSDGLVKDAGRLAAGADAALAIKVGDVPLSTAARVVVAGQSDRIETVLTGGDDYEILFAIPPGNIAKFRSELSSLLFDVTLLGVLAPGSGVTVALPNGENLTIRQTGFDHFARS